MTQMIDVDPLTPCGQCGQTKAWHDANNPQHQFFADGEEPKSLINEPSDEPPAQGKGDLVLRLALIKAGVINEAQLAESEIWLSKAREQGRVLMLEPDDKGVLQWRLLTMDDLRQALGNVTVAP